MCQIRDGMALLLPGCNGFWERTFRSEESGICFLPSARETSLSSQGWGKKKIPLIFTSTDI